MVAISFVSDSVHIFCKQAARRLIHNTSRRTVFDRSKIINSSFRSLFEPKVKEEEAKKVTIKQAKEDIDCERYTFRQADGRRFQV